MNDDLTAPNMLLGPGFDVLVEYCPELIKASLYL